MKITFIQTGGTIDKDYPRTQGGYAFEITTPAVERILTSLNPGFNYEVIPLLRKDSMDITDEDRDVLLEKCTSLDNDMIIITHGTDTLLDTAGVLSGVGGGKVIVLCGAMKPERFKDSDAHANVGVAIGAVQTLDSGVYVVMHGQVFPWDRVTRNPSTGKFVEKG